MKVILSLAVGLVVTLVTFLLLPPGWWTIALLVAMPLLGVGLIACVVRRYEQWTAWSYPSNHVLGGWR